MILLYREEKLLDEAIPHTLSHALHLMPSSEAILVWKNCPPFPQFKVWETGEVQCHLGLPKLGIRLMTTSP